MYEASAGDSDNSTAPEIRLLLRGAERLVTRYGDRADLVAAQLADAFFTAGDDVAGHRWAKIFRILAVSHASLRARIGASTGLH